MSKLEMNVKANVGDMVSVAALELKSVIVVAVYITRFSVGYEIAYFHAGDRKTAYLHESEFELVKR